MATIPDLKQFPKDYLNKVYQYEGNLDFDFFKTRVWWWRLFESYIKDYKEKKGPFIEWVNRIIQGLHKSKLFEVWEEDIPDKDGNKINTITHKDEVNWYLKYLLILWHLEKNIFPNIKDVFRYEYKTRINGKYGQRTNWFNLQAIKQSSGDPDSLDMYIITEDLTYNPFIVYPRDLRIDLLKSQNSQMKKFEKWFKDKKNKFPVSKDASYRGNLNAWNSWPVLEWIDIKHHNLEVPKEENAKYSVTESSRDDRIRQVKRAHKKSEL